MSAILPAIRRLVGGAQSPRPHGRSIREVHLDLISYALHHGDQSTARPALPLELVLAIAFYIHPTVFFRSTTDSEIVSSSSHRVSAKILIKTPPILRVPATLYIRTVSRDQGWVSDPDAGSWTWFELRGLHFDPLVCYYNRVGNQEPFSQEATFPPEHEFWAKISSEDEIALVACAQFPGWVNRISEAEMIVSTPYKPDFHWIEERAAAASNMADRDEAQHDSTITVGGIVKGLSGLFGYSV